MKQKKYDLAVIGGGIVGTATAMALVSMYRASLILLEAEDRLAAHQSGRNSGVIHAGLYYKPGSLKARYCVEGNRDLSRYCMERGISYRRTGKIVIASNEEEVPLLKALEQRGRSNGLTGLKMLGQEEIGEHEPHAAGVSALFVPETGIVNFSNVTESFAEVVRKEGGEIRKGARVSDVKREPGGLILAASKEELYCRYLVNCGGLHSDRIARMCGVDPGLQIIPFRGEYRKIVPERRGLVRNLIYPVPDPKYPFLGVHLTKMIDGEVEAGPNAVLALKREGYGRLDVSLSDTLEALSYPGFWKMANAHWKMGLKEIYSSLSAGAFVKSLRKLVPEMRRSDLLPAGSGVRAQAVEPDGQLVDDFKIVGSTRSIHVLCAPSPAATASIPIGRSIAYLAGRNFDLK